MAQYLHIDLDESTSLPGVISGDLRSGPFRDGAPEALGAGLTPGAVPRGLLGGTSVTFPAPVVQARNDRRDRTGDRVRSLAGTVFPSAPPCPSGRRTWDRAASPTRARRSRQTAEPTNAGTIEVADGGNPAANNMARCVDVILADNVVNTLTIGDGEFNGSDLGPLRTKFSATQPNRKLDDTPIDGVGDCVVVIAGTNNDFAYSSAFDLKTPRKLTPSQVGPGVPKYT